MEAKHICTKINAENTKTRIWVFIAAFLFSMGLWLVFKPRGDEGDGSELFLHALIYGGIFGLIFQYAVRHLNGVNLRPELLEKTFSKFGKSLENEEVKLKLPAAITGFFPKPGILVITDSNVYFAAHKSAKTKAVKRENISEQDFKLADFNADGQEKNLILKTPEKTYRYLIFTQDQEKVEKVL